MVNKNEEVFERMPVPKAVRTMAIPTVIGQLIILIYNMADTFFIGRTNNPYMVAGASLVLPIFNVALSIAGLSGIGGGALISRLLGEKKPEEARKVFSFSVALGVTIAAIFSLLTLVYMTPLMRLLGATGETIGFASSYALCVIVFGAIPTVLTNILATLLRSVGESKKAGFGVTLGGVINMLLDPLFMFVLLPDGMETIGAGIATCLSNCISCGFFIVTIVRLHDPVLKMNAPWKLPTGKSLKGVFGVGLPSCTTTLLFDLNYIIVDRLMAGHGDIALAAIGIVLKAERLPLNVGIGLCQGMMPIIAYNYSAKNYARMNDTRRYTNHLGLIVAISSVVMYELFAPYILRFFISDAETVRFGTLFLRIHCLATPLMFLCFFHTYLFNSFGKGIYSFCLGVSRWVVFNIPAVLLLDYLLGSTGIVWAQATGDVFTLTLSILVYKHYEKKSGMATEVRKIGKA